MDKQTLLCVPFCKAIVDNPAIAVKPSVVALLESFWERCRADESLPRNIRALGIYAESVHYDQRAIAAREAWLELGPPNESERCAFCGGSGYSVRDGTVAKCVSCLGLEWGFE